MSSVKKKNRMKVGAGHNEAKNGNNSGEPKGIRWIRGNHGWRVFFRLPMVGGGGNQWEGGVFQLSAGLRVTR